MKFRITFLFFGALLSGGAHAKAQSEVWFRCRSFMAHLRQHVEIDAYGKALEPRPVDLVESLEVYKNPFGLEYEIAETHLLRPRTKQPWLNEIIRAVEAAGGEVRVVTGSGWFLNGQTKEVSNFQVDPVSGAPRLVFDLGISREHAEHEYQHFLDWKAKRQELMNQGLSAAIAGVRADQYLYSSPAQLYRLELRAVARERQVTGASTSLERDYYPEIAAAHRWLEYVAKRKLTLRNKDSALINEYLRRAIWKVAAHRRDHLEYLRETGAAASAIALERNPLTLSAELGIVEGSELAHLLPRFLEIMKGELPALVDYLE